ncbi:MULTISPECIES: carboxymuconolactone decarboxylase family protein [Flagellimonas]|uniref:Carboxymuconolactone decarboxylase family protein n=1 Tax=Flagellimonas hadalis TaxID=2597517 RepID=A0A5N5IWY1_9FLAO|nr:carboxymuconolactone decarboxylase family protein [Allomuricauda hadalis]KAB5491999.1 carboxymuconolactone decarboxylase family protein [Allomuricauda hadalis]
MEKRIQIDVAEPLAFKAMFGLEKYIQQSQLDIIHYELIKIRASQLNGCAFCINMHTKDALKMGVDPQRLFLLDAWWDTELYSEEEQIILKMTEEITLVHQEGLSQETYNRAVQLFDEHYFAQIVMAIVTINAWNRISISTHKPLQD